MLFGTPLIPTVLLTAFAAVLLVVGAVFVPALGVGVIAVYVPIYAWMRVMTRADDQRLNQLLLRFRMRLKTRGGRHFWGAYTFLPMTYKKR